MPNRSPLRGSSPDFFEPRDLRGEFTDLSVEFFGLRLVSVLLGLGFMLSVKEVRKTRQRQGFPLADLVGMDAIFGGDLRDSFYFLDGLVGDFGFEADACCFLTAL